MILETPRLTLRALAPGDLGALATMYADPEVMRYIGTGGPRGRDDAARAIDRQLVVYAERGFGEWAAVLRESGDMVGLCGLIVWPDIEGTEELEVAYLLAREVWGRGLGTEVAGAIRDWAVRELGRRRLVSCIYPEHPRRSTSQRRSACATRRTSCTRASPWRCTPGRRPPSPDPDHRFARSSISHAWSSTCQAARRRNRRGVHITPPRGPASGSVPAFARSSPSSTAARSTSREAHASAASSFTAAPVSRRR